MCISLSGLGRVFHFVKFDGLLYHARQSTKTVDGRKFQGKSNPECTRNESNIFLCLKWIRVVPVGSVGFPVLLSSWNKLVFYYANSCQSLSTLSSSEQNTTNIRTDSYESNLRVMGTCEILPDISYGFPSMLVVKAIKSCITLPPIPCLIILLWAQGWEICKGHEHEI